MLKTIDNAENKTLDLLDGEKCLYSRREMIKLSSMGIALVLILFDPMKRKAEAAGFVAVAGLVLAAGTFILAVLAYMEGNNDDEPNIVIHGDVNITINNCVRCGACVEASPDPHPNENDDIPIDVFLLCPMSQ